VAAAEPKTERLSWIRTRKDRVPVSKSPKRLSKRAAKRKKVELLVSAYGSQR
jgi:hypothetical protein